MYFFIFYDKQSAPFFPQNANVFFPNADYHIKKDGVHDFNLSAFYILSRSVREVGGWIFIELFSFGLYRIKVWMHFSGNSSKRNTCCMTSKNVSFSKSSMTSFETGTDTWYSIPLFNYNTIIQFCIIKVYFTENIFWSCFLYEFYFLLPPS